MKTNQIINGNCIEIMKTFDSNSIDLIFADPPYWMRTNGKALNRLDGTQYDGVNDSWDIFESDKAYNKFTREWLGECYRVLKPNGSIWVIGSMQCIYTIGQIMQEIGFWFINDVIWHKSNPTPNFKGTRLNNSHETLIWATKNQKSKYTFHYKTAKELNKDVVDFDKGNRRQLGSIWKMPIVNGGERLKDSEGNKLHNTQKPEELLYKIIVISSNVGDLVLDPFGGTMTTGKVAKQTGRRYIIIEQDKKYFEYGKARIENTREQIGCIERAELDIKPLKVRLQDMIEQGYLNDGEQMYLKNKEHSVVCLNKEGKIKYNGTLYDIHKGASVVGEFRADRVNGFDYWCVNRGDMLVPIKDIREQYRNEHSKIKHIDKNVD